LRGITPALEKQVPDRIGILLVGAVVFTLFPHLAFGKGKAENETRPDPINTEWVFCVTALDISALPPARRMMGEVLEAKLVESLKALEYRIRIFPEYTFYEGTAWSVARLEAGKKLAAKRNERDLLLYQGRDGWTYRRSLETINKEIAKLEADLKKAEALIPEIGSKPKFKLTGENERGVFPQAPEPGKEKRFCISQNADAFLSGKVSEFHGRLYVVLRIYAFYADSYIYEDSDIFSLEDLNLAAEEISSHLAAVIAGTEPAAIQVTAVPEGAMVLINKSYAGKGKTEILERSPGSVEVSAYAERHNSQTFSLELPAGELAELFINLTPLAESIFNVELPPGSSGSLYRGALYLGEAPQSLGLSLNQYEYLRVNTPEGNVAQAVLFGGAEPDLVNRISLNPMPPKGEKEIDAVRRKFYGAYGRFWLLLPVAYILQGFSETMTNTYNMTGNVELYGKALTLYYVSIGSVVAAGGFLLESFIREAIYIAISTKYEPKLTRAKKIER
jgi:hypothetical protein